MRKLLELLKWIAKHLVVKSVDLNHQGQCPGDEDTPTKPSVVVGIGGTF